MNQTQPLYCASEHVEDVLQRAKKVLHLVSVIANEPGLVPDRTLDLQCARTALSTAERIFAKRHAAREHHRGCAEAELAAALIQVRAVQALIKETELAKRSAAIKDAQAALQQLRAVSTIRELVERAPIEINRLGYRRVLVSRLRGTEWAARSAFAQDDPGLAEALVHTGNTSPGHIGRELPETEMVRLRAPILIHDAPNKPRVHRELITLAETESYIAAPLIARGDVVGLLHADQHSETGTVSSFDRDLLGLFAEGLGFAFERTVFFEQLDSLRSRLEDQAKSVSDLIDGFLDTDTFTFTKPSEASAAASAPVSSSVPLHPVVWPLTDLTRRELEVLQHLAEGKTNTEIAAKLYVSAETVKTHVKNLLRKLGTPNRAEAVSRYNHLLRPSRNAEHDGGSMRPHPEGP